MQKKILVVDIETTGFSKEKDCILEIGAVVLDIETGKTRKVFDATFKEPHLTAKHRKAWIFENSNMTLDEIRKSKPLEDHREELQKIFDKYKDYITAWNRPFDAGFLEHRGFDLGSPMKDPMRESTDHFGLKNTKGSPKWASVEEAVKLLGISDNFKEAHRGLDDARIEASVIYNLIRLGVYTD